MASRPGIVLPAVLAVLVMLGLLGALALSESLLDWRVATMADDGVRARAGALRALAAAANPPDLAALCVSGPMAAQYLALSEIQGSGARVSWRQLGGGVVRVEALGTGLHGARHRIWALFVPDSADRSMGLFRCPSATALVRVPGHWMGRHPEG